MPIVDLWYILFSFFFIFSFSYRFNRVRSVADILNTVAIQKRLMLDFLTENCALNLTPASNRSSPLSARPSSTVAAISPSARAVNIYSCLNKCGRSYDSLSSLQQHMRLECSTITGPAIPIVKQFDCIYCNETFTRRDHLKLHTRDEHRSMIE